MVNKIYNNRSERIKWLISKFDLQIKKSKSFLDVGCDKKQAEKLLPNNIKKYYGIDISGNPNLKVNLDQIDKLPFKNGEFDVVLCSDVLEHLENIHLIFDELCRVSNKYVIITLPSSSIGFYNYIFNFKRKNAKNKGLYQKFYGLPLEKPVDRHRWFFSCSEAIKFVKYRSKKNKCKLKFIDYDSNHVSSFKKYFYKFIGFLNPNFRGGSTIFLLEK